MRYSTTQKYAKRIGLALVLLQQLDLLTPENEQILFTHAEYAHDIALTFIQLSLAGILNTENIHIILGKIKFLENFFNYIQKNQIPLNQTISKK